MLTKIACFQKKASDFIILKCSIFPDFFEYGGALVCRQPKNLCSAAAAAHQQIRSIPQSDFYFHASLI
jgi:hypothetical protein